MGSIQIYEALRKKTIPGLLLERAKQTPGDVAYRAKKLGLYQERTWREFAERVSSLALGLKGLGLKRGERLALMGDPCEEYVNVELAAQALGAIPFGIYATSSQKQLRELLEEGGACTFVAENQEYIDLILPISDSLKALQHIVVIDIKGLSIEDYPSLTSFDDLLKDGDQQKDRNPEAFPNMIRELSPSDTAFIVYTAGTVGPPKGVMISQGVYHD